MKLFVICFAFFLFSTSTFASTEGTCNNCTEQQRRALAQSIAPYIAEELHRVYINDIDSMTLWAYDVRWEIEPGVSYSMVRSVTIPSNVKDDWDILVHINTVVDIETGGFISVPPSEFESAYDMVNDNGAMNDKFQLWLDYLGLIPIYLPTGGYIPASSAFTLSNAALALSTKIANGEVYSTLEFADGSSIKLHLTHIGMFTGDIEVAFSSAKDADGNSIFQTIESLSGSTITFSDAATALSFAAYIQRNQGIVITPPGGAGAGTWVCQQKATGVECTLTNLN